MINGYAVPRSKWPELKKLNAERYRLVVPAESTEASKLRFIGELEFLGIELERVHIKDGLEKPVVLAHGKKEEVRRR